VLTGCGLQKIGAAVNLGAFYLAGIPVSVLLAFFFRLNGMVYFFVVVVAGDFVLTSL
jgi:MATE family multidrug resistance protein